MRSTRWMATTWLARSTTRSLGTVSTGGWVASRCDPSRLTRRTLRQLSAAASLAPHLLLRAYSWLDHVSGMPRVVRYREYHVAFPRWSPDSPSRSKFQANQQPHMILTEREPGR